MPSEVWHRFSQLKQQLLSAQPECRSQASDAAAPSSSCVPAASLQQDGYPSQRFTAPESSGPNAISIRTAGLTPQAAEQVAKSLSEPGDHARSKHTPASDAAGSSYNTPLSVEDQAGATPQHDTARPHLPGCSPDALPDGKSPVRSGEHRPGANLINRPKQPVGKNKQGHKSSPATKPARSKAETTAKPGWDDSFARAAPAGYTPNVRNAKLLANSSTASPSCQRTGKPQPKQASHQAHGPRAVGPQAASAVAKQGLAAGSLMKQTAQQTGRCFGRTKQAAARLQAGMPQQADTGTGAEMSSAQQPCSAAGKAIGTAGAAAVQCPSVPDGHSTVPWCEDMPVLTMASVGGAHAAREAPGSLFALLDERLQGLSEAAAQPPPSAHEHHSSNGSLGSEYHEDSCATTEHSIEIRSPCSASQRELSSPDILQCLGLCSPEPAAAESAAGSQSSRAWGHMLCAEEQSVPPAVYSGSSGSIVPGANCGDDSQVASSDGSVNRQDSKGPPYLDNTSALWAGQVQHPGVSTEQRQLDSDADVLGPLRQSADAGLHLHQVGAEHVMSSRAALQVATQALERTDRLQRTSVEDNACDLHDLVAQHSLTGGNGGEHNNRSNSGQLWPSEGDQWHKGLSQAGKGMRTSGQPQQRCQPKQAPFSGFHVAQAHSADGSEQYSTDVGSDSLLQ